MNTAPSAGPRSARITAITSGKGGVGKTFVSANLAAALARQGQRVLVLDADLGLANLDVVLNLPPRITLHDVMTGRKPVQDAIVPGPFGMDVLLAGSGMVEYSRLTPDVRERLLRLLDELRPAYDHIFLDTGAGISDVVLYTVSLADRVLVVATAEPTSLTDAYATIKVLAALQKRRRIAMIINQVRRGEGRGVCNQLQLVIDRYVNPDIADGSVQLEFLGELPLDASVREAVAKRRLLLEMLPGSPAAMGIVDIASRLLREA